RRARAQLRAGLERSDDVQVRRGFALLLMATNAGALRVGAVGGAAAAGGIIMSGKMLAAALAVLVVVSWLLPVGAPPWSRAAEVAATVAAAKASPAEHDALASTSDRTPLAAADPQVHLQLEGVHPLLPWTSAISLHVRGRDTDGPHEF